MSKDQKEGKSREKEKFKVLNLEHIVIPKVIKVPGVYPYGAQYFLQTDYGGICAEQDGHSAICTMKVLYRSLHKPECENSFSYHDEHDNVYPELRCETNCKETGSHNHGHRAVPRLGLINLLLRWLIVIRALKTAGQEKYGVLIDFALKALKTYGLDMPFIETRYREYVRTFARTWERLSGNPQADPNHPTCLVRQFERRFNSSNVDVFAAYIRSEQPYWPPYVPYLSGKPTLNSICCCRITPKEEYLGKNFNPKILVRREFLENSPVVSTLNGTKGKALKPQVPAAPVEKRVLRLDSLSDEEETRVSSPVRKARRKAPAEIVREIPLFSKRLRSSAATQRDSDALNSDGDLLATGNSETPFADGNQTVERSDYAVPSADVAVQANLVVSTYDVSVQTDSLRGRTLLKSFNACGIPIPDCKSYMDFLANFAMDTGDSPSYTKDEEGEIGALLLRSFYEILLYIDPSKLAPLKMDRINLPSLHIDFRSFLENRHRFYSLDEVDIPETLLAETVHTQTGLVFDRVVFPDPGSDEEISEPETQNSHLKSKVTRLETPDCRVTHHFGNLFESGRVSDITFFVGRQQFKAHKIVMIARSPVFARMFEIDGRVSPMASLKIEDCEPEVFEAMLRFLYTDQMEETEEMAKKLLPIAEKYQLQLLQFKYEEVLMKSISKDNCAELLLLADIHGATSLKKDTMDFIRRNSADVIKTAGWKTLRQTRPQLGFEIFEFILS